MVRKSCKLKSMSFISFFFLGTILIAAFIYEILPQKYKSSFLLLVSCSFYAFSGIKILLLILISTVLFFNIAIRMQQGNHVHRHRYLMVGILFQAMVLILFKLGVQYHPGIWGILLPLGISYYSFKLLGYLIDVYLEKEKAEMNFVQFANYVTFFPQIVSGPIQRSREFLPQIKGELGTNPQKVASGMRLILCGLFKKLVVSGNLEYHILPFLSANPSHEGLTGLLVIYFMTLQIYADFSGITDIAIGLAKVFGFQTPQNFKQPFYAPNIQEFWKRWHMTLTFWIRDYIFTPLQIATRDFGKAGLVISIVVTMFMVGLWHGISWNWIVFGLLHGLFLSVSALTLGFRDTFFKKHSRINCIRRYIGIFITFHMVVLSFILFRVNTWGDFKYLVDYYFLQLKWLFIIGSSVEGLKFIIFESGFNLSFNELIKIILFIGMMEIIHALQNIPRLKSYFFLIPMPLRWIIYITLIAIITWYGKYDNVRFTYSFF